MTTTNEVGNSITRNTICDKEDLFFITIKELIETEQPHDEAVYVYRVPQSVSCAKPEAFTPQFLALGPYHHSSPKVYYAIENLKVTKAKNNLNIDFSNYIENLKNSNFARTIRYCYDCSIAFKDDPLLYFMTVDSLFLHDLLNCTLEGGVISVTQLKRNISNFIKIPGMPVVNAAGVELTMNAVIRDVFMLENQIPTCILKRIIQEIPRISTINVDEQLSLARQDFCTILCPFDTNRSVPVNPPAHLLDHMYRLIVPEPDSDSEPKPVSEPKPDSELKPDSNPNHNPNPDPDPRTPIDSVSWTSFISSAGKLPVWLICLYFILNPDPRIPILSKFWKICLWTYWCCLPIYLVSILFKRRNRSQRELSMFGKICRSLLYAIVPPIFFMVYLVYVILTELYGDFRSLVGPLANMAKFCYPAAENLHRTLSNSRLPFLKTFTIWVGEVRDILKYIEQSTKKNMDAGRGVTIPSVKELHKAGINFQRADGGISSIKFVVEECKMYLPRIRLDVNSEVIMRNLVAYESLIKSENLIFTGYTELMRAIINTAEDVKLLVDKNIIIIQTDELTPEVVAQLFSGMSKSIKPTKTQALDDMIKEVKDKFDRTQKLRRDIISSGIICAALLALVFLAQTVVKKYCSLFGCDRSSKSGNVPEYGD